MENFRELLERDHVTVFDGAVGTMLYSKGIYINRSYDELNLTSPDLVREVHAEYVRAGAEILETNTFGATASRLQQYGLEGSLRQINVAAARLVQSVETLDGAKLIFADESWLLFRQSGTEPVLRIYSEATSIAKMRALLNEGEQLSRNS